MVRGYIRSQQWSKMTFDVDVTVLPIYREHKGECTVSSNGFFAPKNEGLIKKNIEGEKNEKQPD